MDKNQKDMYQGLWFGTILVILIILFMWISPLISEKLANEFTLNAKIYSTIIAIIALPLAWYFFNKQKKLDKNKQEPSGAYKGLNVAHGIGFKAMAIRWAIGGVLSLILGIYFLISGGTYWWIGLIFLILALLLIILVRNLWKKGSSKIKGRYY